MNKYEELLNDADKSNVIVAEHLNITEEFLVDCLNYYKEKYGLYVRQDNYLIYFEPLGILNLIR